MREIVGKMGSKGDDINKGKGHVVGSRAGE